jgi:hypothetical protein
MQNTLYLEICLIILLVEVDLNGEQLSTKNNK